MGRKTQWLWRINHTLDRKLLSRWVFFGEGDELGASMKGYIFTITSTSTFQRTSSAMRVF